MRMITALSIALIAASALIFTASCGEDEGCKPEELDCDGVCITPIQPTAAAVTEQVLAKSCAQSVCHRGYTAQEGLSLADIEAVKAAVGTPSKQKEDVMLIKAGDAANSYLIHKMRNQNIAAVSSTGKASVMMPPNGLLCEPKIKAVEDWINAGAN